tara:strand:+ start:153 stop:440 length:288 start_codon:yes stop_codon:yes gene_type:complete
MNIQIQSLHFSANSRLKDFVQKKIQKLFGIDDSILNVNVYLKLETSISYDNKMVEIKLHSKTGEYFASKQSASFEESTDLVIQALRKQILKNKDK